MLSWQDMSKEAHEAEGCVCALRVQVVLLARARSPCDCLSRASAVGLPISFQCCWFQEMKEAKVAVRDGDEASWRRHFVRAMNHMAGRDAAGGTGRGPLAAGVARSVAGRSEGAASLVSK